MRRKNAGSTSPGRLVAPSTMTPKPWFSLASWVKPSQSAMNSSVFIDASVGSDTPPRLPMNESTSSMKMMHGASFCASENAARTSFWDSPNHLLMIVLILRSMKNAPDSFAMAFASIVLPVPGFPYSKMPLGTDMSFPRELKNCGHLSGSTTRSWMSRFCCSRPPMSANVTSMSCGSTISPAMTSS